MIIVKLIGGLGNQMFQYAAGKSLAIRNNTGLSLDLSFFSDYATNKLIKRNYGLSNFNIQAEVASKIQVKQFTQRTGIFFLDKIANQFLGKKKTFVLESSSEFSKKIYDSGNDIYLEGYFQSYKYFETVSDVIRKQFILKNDKILSFTFPSEYNLNNTVSIHVRKGDFVGNNFHELKDFEYYTRAIELVKSKLENTSFIIFSDEIAWVKNNLFAFLDKTIYIQSDLDNPENDLILMSLCKHNIIANSSFSWWAAWLNKNKNKIVIAPQNWVNNNNLQYDIYPDNWIKI